MAKKETFTPIWNFDDPEEKNGRKKMTLKELDRERGKRDADREEEKEEMVYHGGMFEEDKIAHKMTKKKEKAIVIAAIIVAIIAIVVIAYLNFKWRHDAFARRYLAAPQSSWSAVMASDMPQTDTL
jgi:hypothetical protein